MKLYGELAEWWEDLWQRGIGSHVVLVPVPSGWGRSTVLGEFQVFASSISKMLLSPPRTSRTIWLPCIRKPRAC